MSSLIQSPGGRASADNGAQSGASLASSDVATESGSFGHAPVAAPEARQPGRPGPELATPAPLPLRAGGLLMAEVIDLYMAHYAGRDSSRVQRLAWWKRQVGQVELQQLSDDHVHAALESLSRQPSRYFAGTDADGRQILKAKPRPLSGATVNRYCASLAAVVTWTIKKRIAPKGMPHPCRSIERHQETDGKTRFLSDEERGRLLEACRASPWPRLYALVLLALTTGARKGELLGLRWADVDLDRSVAHCGRTKNGDPKTLPLVPAVVAELRKIEGAPSSLVFESPRKRSNAFAFEGRFTEALATAKVKAFRFHDLRHSCASMLASSGATLLEIGDVLGHRQLAMTRRYSHLTTQHKAALVNRVLGDIK